MVVQASSSKEWVAFNDGEGDSSGFEAIYSPSAGSSSKKGGATEINHSKKNSTSSSSTKKPPFGKKKTEIDTTMDETQTVATWMKQPIESDASWAPLTPPKTSTERKKRECRTTSGSSPAPLSPPPGSSAPSSARRKAVSQQSSRPQPISVSNSAHQPASSSSLSTPEVHQQRSRREKDPARSRSKDISDLPGTISGTASTTSSASRRGRSQTRVYPSNSERPPSVQRRSSSKTPPIGGGSTTSKRSRSSSTSRRDNVVAVTGTTCGGQPMASSSTTNARSRSTSRSRPPVTQRSRSTSRTQVTRPRSVSRTRSSKPPPSTSRTRREMRSSSHISSSSSVGGPPPSRSMKRTASFSARSVSGVDREFTSTRSAHVDTNIGRDISFDGKAQTSSSNRSATPQRSSIIEKLFGDQVSEEAKQSYLPRSDVLSPTNRSVSSAISWQQPERIHSRILLTATVYHNTATNLWIATINTNQKGVAKNPTTASKFLKAFSFSSEKEARESAIANAPPKMMKFAENPCCFICQGKFAMFRRAAHCRNCGVCVCSSCSTTWPSKMIPETYNLKRESQVKICKTCNHLSVSFKKALLSGDYEEAIGLYGSGNINLRTPFPQFSNKKEEVMHPIHCAVEGGNLDIVRWLLEDHFCPIKVVRTASAKRAKKGGSPDFPILTSKNRSVLTIALENLHVEILRYLVVDNSVSVYEAKDLNTSLRALEAVLIALPQNMGSPNRGGDNFVQQWDDAIFDGETSVASSLGADQTFVDDGTTVSKSSKRPGTESCIICYENPIDCVITPCGHQICCLGCSKNLSACPVCNNRGEFIKIFRP